TIGLIMLTSRKEDIDRIVGLEIGADDYVTKPFHLRELTVRVRNLLRRLRARPDTPSANAGMQRRFRGWSLDLAKRRLTNPEGEMVTLTPGEFGLLTTLVERPGNALTRDQLMDGIGGSDSASTDRSVDVLIGRLRRKLGDDPKAPDFILTVPGVGYMFAETIE
ncbi:MAG: winged helix-turn-helix domain-containing protein, partial [Rhodospirillaceae bacterium]